MKLGGLLITTALATLLPLSAGFAADLSVRAPAVAAPPVFTWTGLYVGVHGGYGWEHLNTRSFAAGVLNNVTTSDRNGFFAGGQIGYNQQFGMFVLGGEVDGAWAHLTGTSSACATAAGCASSTGAVTALGSVRTRLGIAWDTMLIYATGGLGWQQAHTSRTITCSAPIGLTCPAASDVPVPAIVGMTSSASGFDLGWVAGAGVEWAFAPSWSAKAEYLFYNIDTARNYSYPGFAGATRHNESTTHTQTVKVGINYRFAQ